MSLDSCAGWRMVCRNCGLYFFLGGNNLHAVLLMCRCWFGVELGRRETDGSVSSMTSKSRENNNGNNSSSFSSIVCICLLRQNSAQFLPENQTSCRANDHAHLNRLREVLCTLASPRPFCCRYYVSAELGHLMQDQKADKAAIQRLLDTGAQQKRYFLAFFLV